MNNEEIPRPNGQVFHDKFAQLMNVRGIPYMSAESLDKDTNLYHALLVYSGYLLGVNRTHLNDLEREDTVSDVLRRKPIKALKNDINRIKRFMNGSAMRALKNNEYSVRHENHARQNGYDFFTEA